MTQTTGGATQKITDIAGDWVVTACDCRGTDFEDGELHTLERPDSDDPWSCPNCKRTVSEMLS